MFTTGQATAHRHKHKIIPSHTLRTLHHPRFEVMRVTSRPPTNRAWESSASHPSSCFIQIGHLSLSLDLRRAKDKATLFRILPSHPTFRVLPNSNLFHFSFLFLTHPACSRASGRAGRRTNGRTDGWTDDTSRKFVSSVFIYLLFCLEIPLSSAAPISS